MHDDRDAQISAYSKGMRQKVLLSAALLHNPDLLLLDEPFSGLDIGTALVLRSLIQELAARGKVVLFSSLELETVERLCSHVVILHRGKIVADDSIDRLRTLMAAPTLEDIFSQLAIEQDTAAISPENPCMLTKPWDGRLRHSHGSVILADGVDLVTVSERRIARRNQSALKLKSGYGKCGGTGTAAGTNLGSSVRCDEPGNRAGLRAKKICWRAGLASIGSRSRAW